MKTWAKANRGKKRLQSRTWYHTHPEKQRERVLQRHGLTELQFNQMSARQDFRCAICGSDEFPLHVDHDHTTNKVRALLCNGCNTGLGQFHESDVVLERAIEYVHAYR